MIIKVNRELLIIVKITYMVHFTIYRDNHINL